MLSISHLSPRKMPTFVRVVGKFLLTIVAISLSQTLSALFFVFVIQTKPGNYGELDVSGYIGGISNLCVLIPSIWLDGFTANARLIGIAVGQLVSILLTWLASSLVIYVVLRGEDFPVFLSGFLFLAFLILVPAVTTIATMFSMRRANAAGPIHCT